MAITASMVKELRERTGAGMMDCKKMLVEADGDMDAAIELMRKSGAAKADKKASRVAAEGRIIIDISGNNGAILEVNSETDFVAKDDSFMNFANSVMAGILADQPADIQALAALPLENGETVEEMRASLVAKIGENIQVRRFESLSNSGGLLASYSHGSRIGVLVSLIGGNEQLGKDIAMHIAASNPQYIKEEDVAADVLAKEKEILIAQAEGSGKPMPIIEKMVAGRLRKYLAEITLLGQDFVKDTDQTVSQLLADANASVEYFIRYEVGEGIEKKQEDFAAEVAAQIKGD